MKAFHTIDLLRTEHADPRVPAALHLRCSCGWTMVTHDEHIAAAMSRQHIASGNPAPAPAVPSPN